MEQFVIRKRSGLEVPLVKRSPLSAVTSAEQRTELLSEDIVALSVQSVEPIDVSVSDTLHVFGKLYRINKTPSEAKAPNGFTYNITLESIMYDLKRPQWFLPPTVGFSSTGDEPLTADLKGFADVLIYNANRVLGEGTWVLGEFPSGTEIKTLSFPGEKLLSVLQKLCDEYSIEFDIVSTADNINTLHFRKVGNILTDTFEYGKGNELYTLQRDKTTDSLPVTRLYAFGSTKNLKSGYRNFSSRLRLSVNAESYVQDGSIVDPEAEIIEATEIFEDIFPERTGVVTDLVNGDLNSFIDSGMDFDLNEKDANGTKWLIPDTAAIISFVSGNLAGYEFEVQEGGYNHTTKTFSITPFKDERGQMFPDPNSSAFRINVGDKYKILNINMPDSYVEDAEQRLYDKAIERLSELVKRKVQYSLILNEMFFRDVQDFVTVNYFHVGDYITIIDNDLNVNESIRITSFTRDLLRPYRYTLTVSESFDIRILYELIKDNKAVKDVIVRNQLSDPARSRRNWRTTTELTSMLDAVKAEMLLIYVEGGSYSSDIVAETNADGDANKFRTSPGTVQHNEYIENGGLWSVSAFEGTMSQNVPYYVYIKASRANSSATIVLSTTRISVEEDPLFYHFPYGILSSVFDGARVLSSTKGYTRITGNNIHTGRITSNDGLMWIDLDTGEIRGTFRFTSGKSVEQAITDSEGNAIDAAKDYTDTQKEAIDLEISGLNTSLNDLDEYIEGTFSDNIIEESEAIAIEKYLNSLTAEKSAIENRYNVVYGDTLLTGSAKTNLNSAKSVFDTDHTNLIDEIEEAIFDRKTTAAEKAAVDAHFDIYKSSLAILNTRLEEAVNFIAQAKANQAESNATSVANAAQADATAAKNYIDNILPGELSAINDALDGLLEQHFQTYNPTTSNAPASTWTTTELKESHLGDLFYNTSNGRSWRWVKEGTTYSWSEIVNSDLQAALQAASEAQDTADAKRRIFTSQPFTPYDVGDLWVQGANGDIMRCSVAKTAAQSYSASDWVKASKYTDDTAANAAASAASQAQNDANSANTALGKIANDNVLMPNEKQDTLAEWQIIQAEKPIITNQATSFGLSVSALNTAYNSLNTYITPLLSNMTTESAITGTTFRARFKAYYDAKIAVLTAVSDTLKSRIEITPFAQGTGKIFNRPASLGVNSSSNVGYLVISTPITSAYMTRVKVVGYNYVGIRSDIDLTVSFYAYTGNAFHQTSYTNLGNYPINDVQLARDSAGRTIIIIGQSNSAWTYPKIVVESAAIGQHTPPDSYIDGWSMEIKTDISDYTNNSEIENGLDVQTETEASKSMLSDISSDSKITPSEKKQVKIEWDAIVAEKIQIANQATNYGVSKADYEAKYATLNTYITPILSDLATTTNIVGSTFRTNFSNYYASREALLKAISDKAKSLSDAAKSVADDAKGTADEVKDKTGVAYLPPGTIIIDPDTGMITANIINTDLIIAKKFRTGTTGTRVEINIDNDAAIRAFNQTGSVVTETFSVVNGLLKTKGRAGVGGRRMEIDGENNEIIYYGPDNKVMLRIEDDLDSFKDDDSEHTIRPLAGISFRKPFTSNPSNPDTVQITGNGIYANASGAKALLSSFSSDTAYAAIIGYVRRRESFASGDVNAGIVGLSSVSGTYGGFFKHLSSNGVALRVDGNSEFNGGIVTDGILARTTNISMKVELSGQGGNNWNTFVFRNGLLVNVLPYQ